MKGIVAYGAYIPYFRLDRKAIAAALGQPAGKGTRAVASYDEDTTSMGVEAARAALRGAPALRPAGLYFAPPPGPPRPAGSLDRGRHRGGPPPRQWEERFGEHAYAPLGEAAVTAALKQAGITAQALDRLIVAGPPARARKRGA